MRVKSGRRWRLLGLVVLALVTATLVVAAWTRPHVTAGALTRLSPTASTTPPGSHGGAAFTPPAGATTPGSSATSVPARTAVFLGDEYTANATWPRALGQIMGWRVVNMAQEGAGFRVAPRFCRAEPCAAFPAMVPGVADRKPDVVVVAGGAADGDNDLTDPAQRTISGLKAALSDADIIVLSPPSSHVPHPYWMTMHGTALARVASRHGASYVDVSSITTKAESYSPDGALTAEAQVELSSLISNHLR